MPSGRPGRRKTQPHADAFLAIVRAAEDLQRGFVELFKSHDLTLAQYNVLRILRGAGEAGLACGDVSSRLIRHDPDVTRLVDRLERRSLVARRRDSADRRVVRTQITSKGLELLEALEEPVASLHARQLGHVSASALEHIVALMEDASARVR